MQFDIQSTDHPDAPAWAAHARRRLQFGLTRHGESINSVKVRMAHAAGSDMVCQVSIRFADSEPAQVSETGSDPDAVIDRAADRASRLAISRLARARDRARGSFQSTRLNPVARTTAVEKSAASIADPEPQVNEK